MQLLGRLLVASCLILPDLINSFIRSFDYVTLVKCLEIMYIRIWCCTNKLNRFKSRMIYFNWGTYLHEIWCFCSKFFIKETGAKTKSELQINAATCGPLLPHDVAQLIFDRSSVSLVFQSSCGSSVQQEKQRLSNRTENIGAGQLNRFRSVSSLFTRVSFSPAPLLLLLLLIPPSPPPPPPLLMLTPLLICCLFSLSLSLFFFLLFSSHLCRQPVE